MKECDLCGEEVLKLTPCSTGDGEALNLCDECVISNFEDEDDDEEDEDSVPDGAEAADAEIVDE